MSRLETVAVGLEPDVLDLIDALRRTSPDLPSRSAIIRQLVHVAIAVMTDDEAVNALAEHHAEMAKMTAATLETTPEPAWTGSVNLREPAQWSKSDV
ncbi:hypothetical protein ABS771_20020 [Methylobacterium brachiatum]|uniref:Ribbon-helix-helix protein, CopG family n=1 Tax=Methylobacterium brachiatum TaxID=269660 RepID=A0ABV1R4T9_9HYPH